jgi:hypothetical protein
LVFNLDFCGTWAGPTFNEDNSCPVPDPTNQWSSCNIFVGSNPEAFKEAYWEANYLHVLQTPVGISPPASSSMSSVVPAENTSSVSRGGAEGRSMTGTTLTSPLLPRPVGPYSDSATSTMASITAAAFMNSSSATSGDTASDLQGTSVVVEMSTVTEFVVVVSVVVVTSVVTVTEVPP